MSRYIDADALLENLKKQYGEELGWQCTVNMSDVGMMIEDAPTADVVEVKHGYWVRNEDHNAYESEHFCSVCLADGSYDVSNEKYCYNCGAKMDGERKEQ